MNTYLDSIIKVKGKDVTLLQIESDDDKQKWICAYARFDNLDVKKNYLIEEPYVTYQEGNVLGVDTDHSFNENHTLDQKRKSAISQIKRVIDYFTKEE